MREKSSRSLPIPYRIGSRLHRHIGLRAPRYVISFPKSGRTGLRKRRLDDPLTSLPITESPLLWIPHSAARHGEAQPEAEFTAPVTRRLALVTR